MKKEFSKFQIASFKRTAQNVYPLVRRKEKVVNTINELNAELADLQMQIDAYQGPIKAMTGGYSTEDIIIREVIDTGSVDKKGNPIKQTVFKLKYPETVIPVEEPEEKEVPAETAEQDMAAPAEPQSEYVEAL